MNQPAKKLLLRCLAVSVAVHLLCLWGFYQNPLMLHPNSTIFSPKQKPIESIVREIEPSKNIAIEEALNHLFSSSHQAKRPFDYPIAQEEESLFPEREEGSNDLESAKDILETIKTAVSYTSFDLEPDLEMSQHSPHSLEIKNEELVLILPDTMPKIEGELVTLSNIPNIGSGNRLEMDQEDFSEKKQPYPEIREIVALDEISLPILSLDWKTRLQKQKLDIADKKKPEEQPSILVYSTVPLPILEAPKKENFSLPPFEVYPLPLDFPKADNWHQDFRIEVQLLNPGQSHRVPICITCYPLEKREAEPMPQTFYFLVDRSNSIDKHRFEIFKKGVVKALQMLKTGDRFNVIFFDQKITRFSEQPIAVSTKSLSEVTKFIQEQGAGGLFSAGELYGTLEKLFPEPIDEGRVQTAFLLSDGTTLLSTKKLHKTLAQWSKKNKNRIAIYAAAAGEGNHLLLLNLVSSISGGRLIYSDTHASFPRKFAKFVGSLREPIAKDIIVATISDNPDAHLELHSPKKLPAFYGKEPITFFLSSDKLSDFTLLIQGRIQDRWVCLEKKISLEQAKKATRSVEKKWSAAQAHDHFNQFLEDGKTAHLDEAREKMQFFDEKGSVQ